MQYLILNADDFGMSARVNAAVWKAHTEGILTSASLMVAEPGFAEAVEIARQIPTLGVGLHLAVTFDHALLPPHEIPHLVGPDGIFSRDLFRAGIRYFRSKEARQELQREMQAQFARFAATELPWSHADGHQHFHLHPALWDTFLDLCDRYGVHRLRLPREEFRAHFHAGGDGPNENTSGMLVLRLLYRRSLRALRRRRTLGGRPIFFCERVYGQLQSGNMNTDYTLDLLGRLRGATNEIFFHPGSDYAMPLPLAEQRADLRDVELAALLDPAVRSRIAALGLCLGNYARVEAAFRQETA
jgi:hopanoid biosynthesis associated protein HpnK